MEYKRIVPILIIAVLFVVLVFKPEWLFFPIFVWPFELGGDSNFLIGMYMSIIPILSVIGIYFAHKKNVNQIQKNTLYLIGAIVIGVIFIGAYWMLLFRGMFN